MNVNNDPTLSINKSYTMFNSQNNNNLIISIEGNIGSGKSTLLANLKEHFKYNSSVLFLKEPVDDWACIKDISGKTMLELFYEDQSKHAFAFQMMAYISRLAILKETLQRNSNCIIITERSLYTDKMVFAKMLFDNNNISLENYSIYIKWFDTFVDCFKVDKIVYVQTVPIICYDRIQKRSRAGENNIELSYLTNCHGYHEEMLDTSLPSCVCAKQLVLNGNVDIHECPDQLSNWLSDIKAFIWTSTASTVNCVFDKETLSC